MGETETIQVEYQFQYNETSQVLVVRDLDSSLTSLRSFSLLDEIGSSLIKAGHGSLLFDFSTLKILTSSALGTIMNFKDLAEKENRDIQIKLSSEVAEIAGIKNSKIGNIIVA